MGWVKRLVDGEIQRRMGHPDLEFAWQEIRETDPKVQADVITEYVKNGVYTVNGTKALVAPVVETSGITPKEVMLQAMRLHWAANNIVDAVDCAAKVAPYVHPRLIAAAVAVRRPDEMRDDELHAAADEAEQAASALALRGDVPSGAGETRH